MELIETVLLVLSSGLVVSFFTNIWQYWSTRKFSAEERVHQQIYNTFILEGLYQAESAISEYGTATTLALADLIPSLKKVYGKQDARQKIAPSLHRVSQRRLVDQLLNRDYRIFMKRFPRLQVFGMEFYTATKRTIDGYSRILIANLNIDEFMQQVENSVENGYDSDWLCQRLSDAANLLQQTQGYLERRFRYLDDYLQEKGFGNYVKFTKIKDDVNVARLRSELDEYIRYLTDLQKQLTPQTSLALNKWLSEHEDLNPLKS